MAEIVEPNDLNSAALLRARVHPALTGLDGSGVIIVVIDYGFDLLHPAFRTASGETRFGALIDQGGERLERASINALLRQAEADGDRTALDRTYDPHRSTFGRRGVEVGAHGSWVASIAAGSRTAIFSGVAPKATLIGVQLDLPDEAWREEDRDGRPTWLDAARQGSDVLAQWNGWRSYETAPQIIAALEEGYAAARALRPDGIVFNLSIGAWAGGHDQGSDVNRAIERIVEAHGFARAPMIAVVTGTGNAGADGGHVASKIDGARPLRFEWAFKAGCDAPSKCEIWTDCPSDMAVRISASVDGGQTICSLGGSDRGTSAIELADGQIVGIAENRGLVRDGLRAVRLILHPALAQSHKIGVCTRAFEVVVQPSDGASSGTVHAWLERDCDHGATATLKHRVASGARAAVTTSTLTSIACAAGIISVAGLDQAAADDDVLAMSGRGPRPWSGAYSAAETHPAPLLAAPAGGLFGARSKTTGYMRGSGTSGAAAIVSGACALAMQAAEISGQRLEARDLTNVLLGRPDTLPADAGWRADVGLGALRFDASAILAEWTDAQLHPRPVKEKPRDERTLSSPN